ncbi:thioredoxin-related transmembrane protein 2 homolog [Impatiens glandulifera]|uniref:thioredoxin-related transmembrane protein 2 homolog n=1 Tax=Impatiens glandulifera TaxID=253017 RepID=UPI001FB177C4|nr:thioredoxin-related transmembrane protein 2 homolog [Impatiens glandulifera]
MAEKREKNGDGYNPIAMLNQFVAEPSYFFHFLAFFSYIPIRFSVSSQTSDFLVLREVQAVITLLCLGSIKMVKEETWEGFISHILFFGKILLVLLSMLLDYRFALWYVLIFLVIYILTEQPAYQGPGFANQLTPLQLECLLTEGNTSRFWLVEFRSMSLAACVHNSRIFPELSITYSNNNLSFGIVDLGLFPNAAEKFNISLGSGNHLPTYILFASGVEVNRFPEVDFEAKGSKAQISKRNLCRHFELDLHLIRYVNSK